MDGNRIKDRIMINLDLFNRKIRIIKLKLFKKNIRKD
jgi:hypothetical protein